MGQEKGSGRYAFGIREIKNDHELSPQGELAEAEKNLKAWLDNQEIQGILKTNIQNNDYQSCLNIVNSQLEAATMQEKVKAYVNLLEVKILLETILEIKARIDSREKDITQAAA